MVNYQDGKIYTIRCLNNNSLIYVGSTTQPLYKRWWTHKSASKNQTKRLLYDTINTDWDDWYIELYELYPCNSKMELEKREGEVIREIGTLNKIIAGRTDEQYRIDNADKIKQYYILNADKIKEQRKQRYIDNVDKEKEQSKQYHIEYADKLKEYYKQYRIDNADKIKEYRKQYRIDNADKIKEYKKQYRQLHKPNQ